MTTHFSFSDVGQVLPVGSPMRDQLLRLLSVLLGGQPSSLGSTPQEAYTYCQVDEAVNFTPKPGFDQFPQAKPYGVTYLCMGGDALRAANFPCRRHMVNLVNV